MSGDDDIFIASSLIADTPEKEKENATPSDTSVMMQRSGDKGSRSGRKSLLGRRRSSIGRRLSGFGGGGFDANTDQGKLKSMYSSIIKLNSENKITRDKCWGLHLIDYMDKVILDEGGQAGGSRVNFQKASCTLDASVKIYSHRVDATHMSSYSLLENLSRTDGDKADKGSGASVGSSERSTKLGVHETLKNASQLNQSEMDRAFEVDPMFHKMSKIFDEAGSKGMLLNNLNVGDGCKVSFESEIKTASDSSRGTVFSREYEGRGPEGNNTEKLRQSEAGSGSRGANEESCGRRYNDTLENGRCGGISAVSQDDAETSAERPGGMVDVSGLRAKLSELCGDLATLSLCPQLQEFRDLISALDGSSILPPRETATAATASDVDGGDGVSESDGDNGGGFDDLPDGDNASFDGGDGGEDNGTQQIEADPFVADTGECLATPPVSFGAEGVPPFTGGDLSLIGFEGGLDGDMVGSSEGAVVRPTSIEDRLCDDLKIVNDDYSFYESGALAAAAAACANNWAGASHWKFVGVKKKPTRPRRERNTLVGDDDTEALVDDDDEEGNNGRKTRGKRKPPAIDFDGPAVPLAALLAPKAVSSRSRRGKKPVDKTLLSQDYISRAKKDAEEGTLRYVLPENAGFKPRDLAELFLRPGAITKRWAAAEAGTGVGQSQGYTRGFVDGSPTAGGFFVEGNDDLLFADENDDYGGGIGGGGDDDNDGDDNGTQGFHFDGGFIDGEENATKTKGVLGEDGVFVDDFEAEGLLSAERRVEKIDVAYARKAKKVDVRRLKGDLWRKIDSFVSIKREKTEPKMQNDVDEPTHPEGEDSGDRLEEPPEVVDMTFSDIVLDVSSTEEQSGVTVPFYFICVLHLANEKGLKLEGRDDLLDFSVSNDSVG